MFELRLQAAFALAGLLIFGAADAHSQTARQARTLVRPPTAARAQTAIRPQTSVPSRPAVLPETADLAHASAAAAETTAPAQAEAAPETAAPSQPPVAAPADAPGCGRLAGTWPGPGGSGANLVPGDDSRPCRTRFGRDSAGFGAEKAKIGLGKPSTDD